MKWVGRILLGLVVLVGVGVGAMYATGNGFWLKIGYAMAFASPELPFDPDDAVAPPDYADPSNWAALPDRDDLADMVPEGVSTPVVQGTAPVDVFFIHPTGFLKGTSWTFSMDPDTSTEENTRWMMANQASAFNGCCNVYAPRYRQASVYVYVSREEGLRDRVLGFAYQDVARAFDYFLENYNQGRPFVIASHSQGTHHGIRLLKEKIDGTALAERLVAAYIIGGALAMSQFESMQDVGLCDSPTDLGCAVHWDTFNEAVIDKGQPDRVGNVCTNPLNWRLNGRLGGKEQHVGAVPVSGEFSLDFLGDDGARGVVFEPLSKPIPNLVQAQCRDGVLYISDQADTGFERFAGSRGGKGIYHGLDYPIFHMDIRENVQLRVATYLERAASAER